MNPETTPGVRADNPAAVDPNFARLEWLATLGELAGPVVHEVNNFLNTVSLQIAILERHASDALLNDLAEIKRQCREVTGVIQHWQQLRQLPPDADQETDLNELVRAVTLKVARDQPGAVRLELASTLPPAAVFTSDLERLVSFLLRNTLATSATVTVRTARAHDALQLSFAVGGEVTPEVLARYFEPISHGRPGINGLELAACKTIVRRLEGTLKATSNPNDGVVITATLPAARRESR